MDDIFDIVTNNIIHTYGAGHEERFTISPLKFPDEKCLITIFTDILIETVRKENIVVFLHE